MRISRLDLLAFGPFTNVSLDLSPGEHGLHLIYGPNEAGKSSALRALRQLLYGIDTRSADSFVHPNDKLRIGATLRSAAGDELQCIRRKGRAKTLRASDDDTVIDDALLAQMLGGVDEETFRKRYGIDYGELVDGGHAIVSGGGDLGRALFAAAAGIADLGQVQRTLAAEADQLFVPAGKVREINKSLAALKERQSQVKSLLLPTAEWKSHEKALAEAEARQRTLQENIQQRSALRASRERIGLALPLAARQSLLRDECSKLASVPLLADDFAEERRKAETELALAEHTVKAAASEIEHMDEQLSVAASCSGISRARPSRRPIAGGIGQAPQAQEDRQRLSLQREGHERDAQSLSVELGRPQLQLNAAEELRLPKHQRARIQTLGNEKGKLVERVEAARKRHARLVTKVAEAEQQFGAMAPTRNYQSLQQAVLAVQQAGPLEREHATAKSQVAELAATLARQLAALRLWKGTTDELERLPLPADETIDRFAQQFRSANQQCETARERLATGERDLTEIDEQIEQLRLALGVPTEDDLLEVRRERDAIWQLIEAQLVAAKFDKSTREAGAELASRYAQAASLADQLADRLRREATQVARKSELLASRRKAQARIERDRAAVNAAADQLTDVERQWLAQWQQLGVLPQSPAEMAAWLRDVRETLSTLSQQRSLVAEVARLAAMIQEHRALLQSACAATNEAAPREEETLSQLAVRCQQAVEKLRCEEQQRDSLAKRRAELAEELKDADLAIGEAVADLETWGAEWKSVTARLQLREAAGPDEANAVIDTIAAWLDHGSKAEELARRIAGIDRDAAAFIASVQQLCSAISPALLAIAPEQAVVRMGDMLTQARATSAKRDQLELQRREQQQRSRAGEADRQQASAMLAALCREAGCASADDLVHAEQASRRRRDVEKDLRDVETRLVELACGKPLDDFLQEVQACTSEQIAHEITQLANELQQLDGERSQILQTIGEMRNEFKRMNGNALAAQCKRRQKCCWPRFARMPSAMRACNSPPSCCARPSIAIARSTKARCCCGRASCLRN